MFKFLSNIVKHYRKYNVQTFSKRRQTIIVIEGRKLKIKNNQSTSNSSYRKYNVQTSSNHHYHHVHIIKIKNSQNQSVSTSHSNLKASNGNCSTANISATRNQIRKFLHASSQACLSLSLFLWISLIRSRGVLELVFWSVAHWETSWGQRVTGATLAHLCQRAYVRPVHRVWRRRNAFGDGHR